MESSILAIAMKVFLNVLSFFGALIAGAFFVAFLWWLSQFIG